MIKENNILQEDHDLHASDNDDAADNTSEHKHMQPSKHEQLFYPKSMHKDVVKTERNVEIQKEELKKKVLRKGMRSNEEQQIKKHIASNHPTSCDHPTTSATSALIDLLKLQSAPQVEIDTFDGDPLEYVYFIANFKDMVESVVSDQRGRLNRLIQYTAGEAKDLIRHCVHNNHLNCYDDALALLEQEYGNPLRIACAYMDKLKKWPILKLGDGQGYKNLYRFLLQCRAYQKGGFLDGLDSPLMIRTIQLKLPIQGQDKWVNFVTKKRKRERKEASFKDFVEFVETEMLVLNDPVYSRDRSEQKPDREHERLKALSVKENVAPAPDPKCQLCDGKHDLDVCEQFMNMNVKDRKQFIFTSRLCFACLSVGHRAKDCKQKKTCNICEKDHPSVLHIYKTLSVVNAGSGSAMSIIPVRLCHKNTPGKEILVYALLDEGSQGTFIQEDILAMFSDVDKTAKTMGTQTLHGVEVIHTFSASGFSITCTAKHAHINNLTPEAVQLPVLHSRADLPFDKQDIPSRDHLRKWNHLKRVSDSLCDEEDIPIGLLIGRNSPLSLEPVEVIPSSNGGPYAYRTRVGWLVSDVVDSSRKYHGDTVKVNFTRCHWPANDITTGRPSKVCFSVMNEMKDIGVEQALKDVWNADTMEKNSEKMALSAEDRLFLQIMKNNIRMIDGHYELPLPFRQPNPNMPCNKNQAIKRTFSIKKRMIKDPSFHTEYTNFMNKFIDSGYARPAKSIEEPGWFLFHHAVFHPTKKKIRVVFDGGAEVDGVSLNNQLLQGPDLTNQMVGVFMRFRKERVPIIGDLESMYCQVRVPEHHRKYLRFLFWPDGDLNQELQVYEMCVHIFGAVSSMGCVNYALHKTADDNEAEFGSDAARTLRDDFYVDDMGTSVESDSKAIELIKNTDLMCEAGGFNLTKIMSCSPAVMAVVPPEKRSESSKSFNLKGPSTVEKPLGVQWTIENDELGFSITFKTGPLSRRGILATISGVYDLLGIASPFILRGRKILQEITAEKVGWDAEVDSKHIHSWNVWKEDMLLLNELKVSRCYKPPDFGNVVDVSLHTFGDGCKIGYGAACYLRQVDDEGKICVALVMGKAKVSPLKMISIPRVELAASTVVAKLAEMVKEGLKFEEIKMIYYTDSKVALGYICNDVKRFRVFVSNRHQLIRSYTEKHQWRHIDTKENPADDASRGLSMKQSDKVHRWLYGPQFLYHEPTDHCPAAIIDSSNLIPEDDPEVINCVNVCSVKEESILDVLERRISKWTRMKRTMAAVLYFVRKIKKRVKDKGSVTRKEGDSSLNLTKEELRQAEKGIMDQVTVENLREAERCLILMSQSSHFSQELSALKGKVEKQRVDVATPKRTVHFAEEHSDSSATQAKKDNKPSARTQTRVRKKSLRRMYKLDPFLDEHGIMRVGGRISNSTEKNEIKFPVILPRKSTLSKRIVEHFHHSVEHGGRSSTVNEIRSNGYWILGISSIVRSSIYHCVGCRVQRGAMGCQKMSNLPIERMSSEPPFTYCGVDMFGPFTIKEGRKLHKRYCALFTCLSSRAIHIEVTASMNTDSFIQALRRFIARRGVVRTIRSDNGGNFVGTENELLKAWKEMNQTQIIDYLNSNNCDWVTWERNVPVASHMGGAWERQIRTVRGVLNSMLKSDTRPLDNEAFCTLMAEVEAIVNSRPLTIENINDPSSMPLTPNHLLTLKSKVVMPPPGNFQSADVYCRKRWRAVQHLANVFWNRWRKEYLQSLQVRKKWTEKKRNFCIGDVVLLEEPDNIRNNWPMGVVVAAVPSDDGLVRTVEIKVASGSIMKRPITKLVLLVESQQEEEVNNNSDSDNNSKESGNDNDNQNNSNYNSINNNNNTSENNNDDDDSNNVNDDP